MADFLETNSTDGSETNIFDRWDRNVHWPVIFSLLSSWLNSLMMFLKPITATIAFISLILFLLPGHPAYYETASGILGKMYSNTMMVVLNSRIVLQTQDESAMLDERLPSSSSVSNQGVSGRSASGAFPSGISVTHEEWTVPLDVCKRHNVRISLP